MDEITKLAVVSDRNCRYVCEVPPRADLSAGDGVIYERMDGQFVGEAVNVVELTGTVGTAVTDFIADLLGVCTFCRIIGAVQMFDWSREAVDDDGDEGVTHDD